MLRVSPFFILNVVDVGCDPVSAASALTGSRVRIMASMSKPAKNRFFVIVPPKSNIFMFCPLPRAGSTLFRATLFGMDRIHIPFYRLPRSEMRIMMN